jgi:hypothetical protein
MHFGDSQMFLVDSKQREQVWTWAHQLDIGIEYNGTNFGNDIWRVVDSKHCVLFALRWA